MHGVCWIQVIVCPYVSDIRFAEAILRAANGERGIIQQSYVYLPAIPGGSDVQKSLDGVDYFSTSVEFGVAPPSDPLAD